MNGDNFGGILVVLMEIMVEGLVVVVMMIMMILILVVLVW